MIAGINPFHILYIEARSFRRRGNHTYLAIITAKCSWYNRVWLYFNYKFMNDCAFDYVQLPEVHLVGVNGRYLASIECKSNAEAAKLCADLTQQLSDFVDQIGTCGKDVAAEAPAEAPAE
jgi:hypothetical protein